MTKRYRTDDMAWADRGACRDADPELFFPSRESSPAQVVAAKRICGGCPVLKQCGDYAVAAGERIGIWGGMTGDERREIRREARQRLRVK